MAHLSHALPWGALASIFTYAEEPRRLGYRTNFITDMSDAQKLKLHYFAVAFERFLRDLSSNLRGKYPKDLEPYASDENVLTEDERIKTKKSFEYGHEVETGSSYGFSCPLHFHPPGDCKCREVFTDPRKFGAWVNLFSCSSCCDRIGYKEIVDQIKVMLMHDQIEPLLRAAAHPHIHLSRLFDFYFDGPLASGWSELLDAALGAYIVLNILYLKPTTWPSFVKVENGKKAADYRRTAVYQRMVTICTATRNYDVHTLPHRLFFGIPLGTLCLSTCRGGDPLVGMFPLSSQYKEEVRNKYFPTSSDVDLVTLTLRRKGMPLEIINHILKFASYAPTTRLKVADDPLHPMNEDELKKYLSYCWKLIIRCDILMEASGDRFDWTGEVQNKVIKLFYDYPKYRNVAYSYLNERPGTWIRNFGWDLPSSKLTLGGNSFV